MRTKILGPVCLYKSCAKATFAGWESLAGSFCCASSLPVEVHNPGESAAHATENTSPHQASSLLSECF